MDGVVIVFSLTDPKSFQGAFDWFKEIREVSGCPIILIGNKADLVGEMQIPDHILTTLKMDYGMHCFKTSAVSGENVEEAFDLIIQLAYDSKSFDQPKERIRL